MADIDIAINVSPILKDRSKINISMVLAVDMDFAFELKFLNPFVPFAKTNSEFKEFVKVEVDNVAHRWALEFPNIESVLSVKSYEAIATKIKRIFSLRFTIRKVIIRSILPG